MIINLIPHSHASNSYELLEDVCRVIVEEPKRFFWGAWFKDLDGDYVREYGPKTWQDRNFKPACGTVACVSGWISLITEPTLKGFDERVAEYNFKWFPAVLRNDLDLVFYAKYAGPGKSLPFAKINQIAGESHADYADRGIAMIRQFMADHEVTLKNHHIEIPRRVD